MSFIPAFSPSPSPSPSSPSPFPSTSPFPSSTASFFSSSTPIKEANETTTFHPLAALSGGRKGALLVLFCGGQFLDNFCISALLSAIPAMANDVGLNDSQSVWLNGAYQLTLASFLLISGRMSDIYNPKFVFLSGLILLGLLSLGTGFVRNKIALIVLRAFGGICVSLTIPSSLNLVVHMFPDPTAQAKAVSAFAGSAGVGNNVGLIIGAIFVSYASWPWIFWVITIAALLIAALCSVLIPSRGPAANSTESVKETRTLDLVGVSTLTITIVLFIFAVTSASTDGWGKPVVLVPLILSIFLIVAFFMWEARIPEENAALPPRMWHYRNFTVLSLVALVPFAWWNCVYLLYSWLWQEVYGWSSIMTAVHFLPVCLVPLLVVTLCGALEQRFPTKRMLLFGFSLMLSGTVLLPFADRQSRYASFALPGFILGTAGTTVVYATLSVAIFAVTPPKVAGTVGAIFNCALQLGSAVIDAVATSIQTSVQDTPIEYKGRAAGFWFLLAAVALATLGIVIFFRELPATERPKGQQSFPVEVVSTPMVVSISAPMVEVVLPPRLEIVLPPPRVQLRS